MLLCGQFCFWSLCENIRAFLYNSKKGSKYPPRETQCCFNTDNDLKRWLWQKLFCTLTSVTLAQSCLLPFLRVSCSSTEMCKLMFWELCNTWMDPGITQRIKRTEKLYFGQNYQCLFTISIRTQPQLVPLLMIRNDTL